MAGFISSDGGATWPTTISIGPNGGYGTYCKAFVFAPGNNAVRYAGGSESYKVKIWRTSGMFWKDITGDLSTFHATYDVIEDIWVSPDDPDTLLVATTRGVFSTDDAGVTWNATSITTGVKDFVYHEAMGILYTGTSADGVHITSDGGATWQALNNGLDTMDINCMGIDTKNGLLYAGTNGGSGWRLALEMPLMADPAEIAAGTGGTVDLSLDASADNAGRNYLILGSVTGTAPGYPLPGGATLPLNWDVYTDLVFAFLNTPLFSNFLGALDGNGQSAAQINAPPLPPTAVGAILYHAYCLNNPFDFASNPVGIEIVP